MAEPGIADAVNDWRALFNAATAVDECLSATEEGPPADITELGVDQTGQDALYKLHVALAAGEFSGVRAARHRSAPRSPSPRRARTR